MTVGHVSVVAGVLLAGENPSAWEAITAASGSNTQDETETKRKRSLSVQLKRSFYRTTFKSKYRLAWMWDRGTNKAAWLARLVNENKELKSFQREVLHMGWSGWLFQTTVPAVLLYLIPVFLGGMTRYSA